MTKKFLGALALALGLAAFTVSAEPLLKANVPFSFLANGKLMPAGEYELSVDLMNENVTVNSVGKGESAIVPIQTRLAPPPHPSGDDTHLVFDKVNNTYTLSEVIEPTHDGLVLNTMHGPHEHHVIHVRR